MHSAPQSATLGVFLVSMGVKDLIRSSLQGVLCVLRPVNAYLKTGSLLLARILRSAAPAAPYPLRDL